MRRFLLVIAVAGMAVLLASSCYAAQVQTRSRTNYQPVIDPADFVGVIDNPYFPLIPGTTFIYEGTDGGDPARDEMTVTHDTKVILGVTCTVVLDEFFTDDVRRERTFDWYAQDVFGNVWYFGEDTAEFDDEGNVISTEGSWEAGVDGAFPGIIMEANPRSGDAYRQEFAPGVAEDMARVLTLQRHVSVPFGDFTGVLLTMEWTILERGVIGHKYYARGVGLVLDVTAREKERLELVDITVE